MTEPRRSDTESLPPYLRTLIQLTELDVESERDQPKRPRRFWVVVLSVVSIALVALTALGGILGLLLADTDVPAALWAVELIAVGVLAVTALAVVFAGLAEK